MALAFKKWKGGAARLQALRHRHCDKCKQEHQHGSDDGQNDRHQRDNFFYYVVGTIVGR